MSARLFAVFAVVVTTSCGRVVVSEDAGGGGATGGGVAGGGAAAGGMAAGGSTAGGSTAGGAAGGGTSGGTAGCGDGGACGVGRTCCNGQCVNTANDPENCGACFVRCTGATPYCGGTFTAAPCSLDAGVCGMGQTCCGTTCCGAGQLCCDPQGPVSGFSTCYTPTSQQPTCPQGCAPLCISDRALKTDVAPIDERAVLQKVATLPLSTWRYTSDPRDVRHLGPMAQDFKATFGLGDTDKAYHPIDAHGVELASIKALFQMVQEQDARLKKLEAENAKLRAACPSTGPTR